VIADCGIWRAADVLTKEHGDDAEPIPAQRADALLAEGELESHRFFKAVLEAVEELRRKSPKDGERIN
jgi:hypothetical protein